MTRPRRPRVYEKPAEANVFEERVDADLFGEIRRWLEEQGVDVDRELEFAGNRAKRAAAADKAAADHLVFLGRAVIRAKREVDSERDYWVRMGRRRQDLQRLTESMGHVDELKRMLREACVNDPDLYDEAMRAARRGVR